MATATKLLTIEEFAEIPNPPGGVYELFHGELNFVPYPKVEHKDTQYNLRELLSAIAGRGWTVREEYPYCPLGDHEQWAADVAAVSLARHSQIVNWLQGAPELVVEVLSPSNTASEMIEKAAIALANGSIQFWEVNTDKPRVRVTHRDGRSILYSPGQTIPLDEVFGNGQLTVDAIFASDTAPAE